MNPSKAGLQKPPDNVKTCLIPLSFRALALGANYVMLGRPLMYGIGADGEKGLRRILNIIKDELSTALGLVGLTDISNVSSEIIAKKFIQNMKY